MKNLDALYLTFLIGCVMGYIGHKLGLPWIDRIFLAFCISQIIGFFYLEIKNDR